MKFRWDKKYLYWGITAFLVMVAGMLFFGVMNAWPGIRQGLREVIIALRPVLYGLIIAYLLTPLVNWMEKAFLRKVCEKLFRRWPKRINGLMRGISIFIALTVTLMFIVAMLILVLPQIYESAKNLAINMPGYVNSGIGLVEKFFAANPDVEKALVNALSNISVSVSDWIQNSVLPAAEDIVVKVSSGVISVILEIVNILIGIIVSVYILFSKETFTAQWKKLIYGIFPRKAAAGVVNGIAYTHKVFGTTIMCRLIDALFVGILCFVVLLIFGIPYAGLVSLIVGVTNIIPFFGPFIGAVPSALLILLVSPRKCLVFIIVVLILQQVDGNIIEPKILGVSTGLSSFWVVFSLLVGGALFGVLGMICAVPAFAVIYTAVRKICTLMLKRKGLPADTAEYCGTSPDKNDTAEQPDGKNTEV